MAPFGPCTASACPTGSSRASSNRLGILERRHPGHEIINLSSSRASPNRCGEKMLTASPHRAGFSRLLWAGKGALVCPGIAHDSNLSCHLNPKPYTLTATEPQLEPQLSGNGGWGPHPLTRPQDRPGHRLPDLRAWQGGGSVNGSVAAGVPAQLLLSCSQSRRLSCSLGGGCCARGRSPTFDHGLVRIVWCGVAANDRYGPCRGACGGGAS